MILVTGGTGRIGNVLVKKLSEKYGKVKVLVREESDLTSLNGCDCEYVYGDILDIESLRKEFLDIDTVFHLAGYINISIYDRKKTYDTNVNGTKNIIELCLEHKVNLVYTSSIHALSTKDKVITENSQLCIDTLERRGIYDQTKALATKEVLKAIEQGLKAIIIMPTGVIGPYDFKPSSFGRGMIQSIKMGLSSTLDGMYDYVDVRDVVSGILKAYELNKYGEKFILSGGLVDMKTYIKYLREFEKKEIEAPLTVINKNMSMFMGFILGLLNKKSTISAYSVATLHSNCNISHKKASDILGYTPRNPKVSLYDQYLWFKENGYI